MQLPKAERDIMRTARRPALAHIFILQRNDYTTLARSKAINATVQESLES